MKRVLNAVALLSLVAALGACSSKFKTYDGPEVTRVVVQKSARRMYLLHHDQVLASHEIDLGFMPQGHKQFEGDGRTPEGRYYIDKRNPNSSYHLSVGISYPNPSDIARARKMGWDPGGEIFIHGEAKPLVARQGSDWTAGCIAVTNDEIEWIYAMVKEGTVVDIFP